MSFDECPYVISGDIDSEQLADLNVVGDMGETLISTGIDASLNDTRCDAFLRAHAATLVAVVAGPNAGKTTLLATIYELLRRGMLSGFGFAGSETIRGFEERCFLSRANSGKEKPDTQHTPARAGLNFTHLKVGVGRNCKHLLLSDRSGEFFQSAQNTPNLIESFAELQRADTILLVLDGELLATEPHQQVSESRKLLLSLAQSKMIPGKPVKLVVTKIDLISDSKKSSVTDIVDDFEKECRRRVPDIELSVHFTAARPKKGDTAFGEGILELMKDILANKPEIPFSMSYAQPSSFVGPSILMLRITGDAQ